MSFQPDIFIDPITQLSPYQELIDRLKNGQATSSLALPRAARLPVLAALAKDLQRPILLLTDRADHALTLLEELSLWAPEANRLYFPEPNPLFYEKAPWGPTTRRDRLTVLTALAAYLIPGVDRPAPPIIVAPVRAVMARTLPRREFIKATRSIKRGQMFMLDELVRSWLELGYEPVNIVSAPGQFARRGGLLDFWPPAEAQPVRIEFFGDEVDTLRAFDPATQRTDHTLERVLITPAREYVIRDPLPLGLAEVEEPIEFHIPLMYKTPAGLLDYLPPTTLVLVDDVEALVDTINEVEEQALNLRQDAVQNGNLPADYPIPYLTRDQIQDSLDASQFVGLGPYAAVENPQQEMLRNAFIPGPRYGGRLKPLFEDVIQLIRLGDQVVLVSRQSSRLKEIWDETGPGTSLDEIQADNPLFVHASLSEGWILTPPPAENGNAARRLHLLTDGEIFGWQRPQPRQRSRPIAEAPEAMYADLQIGDLVVHVDHGIGIYMGLVQRTIEGIHNEYLCIEYAAGDQLFVPVFQADRITSYVGPDNRTPTLTRLGGTEWRSAKTRVKEAVEEVAQDLLELYARRLVVIGHSFPQDSVWMQELEASFPYIETDDQLQVLKEVKRDMENPRPMDRLICGDVGYGKTEIALRAAFKAVLDGKQVLMLVPTTVLAQQHYETFRERLAPFPVEVEMLSRFRTPQEQQAIIQHLAAGTVDIVIGTHRLLSSDVIVKDLGLLIIDEEQRFGVTHKERLKQMRTEVDVLTLTATPIPRTLYMALTGVRDISTLNTPPAERLPVITHVGPYNPRLVRQAILRELERGGQVFFVHNRVQTIEGMHQHLEKLIPEARITVAHGQMNEQQLSTRMRQFSEGEVDVLLSTSIIESGLDIPNANTLIIDRADTFGLAQLYQLRGRVGRGAQRAYAYFFRHNKLPPTPEGRQRLETIAENTQLGAGFSIAMRDLEIRGAGDLLGTRQHGHIAAVGFHLYTRLLADAVRRMQSDAHIQIQRPEAVKAFPELMEELQRPIVNVDLPLTVSIPEDYVGDKTVRLRLYRRVANLHTLREIESLTAEFTDRFGPPPQSVLNLLYQLKIKLLAEQAGAFSVSAEGGLIAVRFPPLADDRTPRSFPFLGSNVRTGKNGLWFDYRNHENWQERLVELLNELGTWQQLPEEHNPAL
jgi:transcription-repair coupling factor (superfamily II helicase)